MSDTVVGEVIGVNGHDGKELLALGNDNLLDVVLYAEKQIEAVKKIKSIVLRLTRADDWTDQGGKPYLSASGCHKVAGVFGISWRFIGEPKKAHEEGGHYRYETMLSVFMGRRSIEVMGSRQSNDPFFTVRYRDGKKVELPASEIDGGDILKASITNAQAIGISALLGIRNLTWEDLEEAGIARDSVAGKVEYKKPEMSEEAQTQKEAIWKMLLEMGLGKPENAKKLLVKATTFTGKDGKEVPGKNDLNKISEKQMAVTYGKVKDAYEKWQKEKAKKQKKQDAPEEEKAETSGEIAKGFAEEMGDGKDGQQAIG